MPNASIVDPSTGKVVTGQVIQASGAAQAVTGQANSVAVFAGAPTFQDQGRPAVLDTVNEKMTDSVYSGYTPSPVAAESRHTFFVDTVGTQGLRLTNVIQPGMIPFSEKFMVRGLGAFVIPYVRNIGVLADYTNLNRILDGSFSIQVNNKIYEQGPLGVIASFNVEAEGQINASTAQLFLASPFYKSRGYWPLPNPFVLLSGAPFKVDVEWATAPDIGQPWTLYLVFFGERLRMSV